MFGTAVHEALVRETIDAMLAAGLRDCGYSYVVIDDGWSHKAGRDRHGDLVPDPDRFPGGLAALAEYAHARGFKLGLYSDAAELTCAGQPGSLGYEEQDAALWAAWGIDLLKYDYCHAPADQATAIRRYARMGAALRRTGRPILYALCEWGGRSPQLWGRGVGGHTWRVSGDVVDRWSDVDAALDISAGLQSYGGPGGWNDLDMLVVGLQGRGQVPGGGMTFVEYQTHMSLWCVACSPLMIGCDVRNMDPDTAALLMNRQVLALNQDKLGLPAKRVSVLEPCEIWSKPLADQSLAVALINRGASGCEVTLQAAGLGLSGRPKLVRDLWTQADTAEFTLELTRPVPPHATLLLKVSPAGDR